MDKDKQLKKFIDENKTDIPIYIGVIAIVVLSIAILTLIMYLNLDFK